MPYAFLCKALLPPMDASHKQHNYSAFSLIETTISLGILTIALSCLLTALPPVFAIRNFVEHDTYASFIAQNLLAEICTFKQLGENTAPLFSIPIKSEATYFISLNQQGDVIHLLDRSTFDHGLPDGSYLAQVHLSKPNDISSALAEVEIRIEWPGCVDSRARKHRFYHTLILCL